MDPALGSQRRADLDPGTPPLEQLDLVVGLQLADRDAPNLIGDVGQGNQVVAHDPPLEPRAGGPGEGHGRGGHGRDLGCLVAGRLERGPPPAGHQGLAVGFVERRARCRRGRRCRGRQRGRNDRSGWRDRLGLGRLRLLLLAGLGRHCDGRGGREGRSRTAERRGRERSQGGLGSTATATCHDPQPSCRDGCGGQEDQQRQSAAAGWRLEQERPGSRWVVGRRRARPGAADHAQQPIARARAGGGRRSRDSRWSSGDGQRGFRSWLWRRRRVVPPTVGVGVGVRLGVGLGVGFGVGFGVGVGVGGLAAGVTTLIGVGAPVRVALAAIAARP